MSYTPYKPDMLEPMFFRIFNIIPVIYDRNTFSLQELVMSAMGRINEVITEINDVGEALVVFENHIISELSKYDEKIQTEVTTILNQYITDGTIADLINDTLLVNINSDIENLKTSVGLLSYVAPSSILSILPSQTIYNKGETVNGIILNTLITQGSKNITEIKYYKNNILVFAKSTGITLNESYLDANLINSDVEYYVEILDGETIIQTNKIKINFINSFYHGSIDENVTITESLIKSLTMVKVLKSDLEGIYNANSQNILFAYPSSYGDLLSIIDSDNYDMIEGFTKSVVNLTLNSVQVPYNVYVTNNAIIDNYVKLIFEF